MVINENEASFEVLSNSKTLVEVTIPKPNAIDKEAPGLNLSSGSLNLKNFNDDQGTKAGIHKISSWGNNNKFPEELRNLFQNNIFPGLIDFKQDMFFGMGPHLVNEQGVTVSDPEVEEWAERIELTEFLVNTFADMAFYENAFVQMIRNKGKDRLRPVHVEAQDCRLTVRNPKTNKSEFILVKNWENYSDKPTPFKAWDRLNPLASPNTILHLKKKTPGFRYYALPVYIGILFKWIPLANEIPNFHLNRLQRSINLKYHVKIPIESLRKKKEMEGWSQTQLTKWFDDKMAELDAMLSGSSNAGKTFYSFIAHDSSGRQLEGWEINLIGNNEKEMSEANLQLFNETNQAITSGMQVQPSLACIQLGQKMSSGSEVLNAYNLHIKTRTPIVRDLVMFPVNAALKATWPNKKLRYKILDPVLVKQEIDKSGIIDPSV